MKEFVMTAVAVGAMLFGSLTSAQISQAAQTPTHDNVYTQPAAPKVHAFDCRGTTGAMGCGPGWFWRDGWRGWACYPC